jgi:hypothetical protein
MVICKICRKTFKYLPRHIIGTHGISIEEYLKKFPGASLGVNPMQRSEVAAKFKVPKSEEHKKRISNAHKGKKHTEEHRKHSQVAIKVAMQNFRGENNPMSRPEVKQKHQEAVNEESYRKLIGERSREVWSNPETRKKASETHKKQWKDPEYVEIITKAVSKGCNNRPNKAEKKLNQLLQRIVPGEYAYNGNYECKLLLDNKFPDFVNVNGKKKVIELYGDYWHEGEDPQKRIDLFKQYGYGTLVIWEHELEHSHELVAKIMEFGDLPYEKLGRQLSLFEMGEIEK